MQIIIFTLNDIFYGIDTDYVKEINKMMDFIPVPKAPNFVKGLINLRGNIVTLMDTNLLLSMDMTNEYNHIMVLFDDKEEIAITVKEIVEIINISEDKISIASDLSDEISGILEVNGKIVNIIDVKILMSKNEGLK